MNTLDARDVQTLLGYLLDVAPITPAAHAQAQGAAYRLAATALDRLGDGGPVPVEVARWFDDLVLPATLTAGPVSCPDCGVSDDVDCQCEESADDQWCECCGFMVEECECPSTCPACRAQDRGDLVEAEEAQE